MTLMDKIMAINSTVNGIVWGIPMLILDGDGIDRRNSHDGQIRTRLEAFLEMLEAEQKVC